MPRSTLFAGCSPRRVTCVAASLVMFAGCREAKEPPDNPPPSTTTSSTASTSVATTVTTTPAAAPTVAPAPATGATHDVRMIADAVGYRFEPASLTIKRGDAVRWIMVSGGPHNVSFWADSVPPGAAALLGGAMAKQLSPLAGPLLMQPNESYTISFVGAPAGTYRYFCTPHLLMGMKATLTVQ